MGEICVGKAGQTLGTLLGSCVGVLLVDERRSLAALAHIQLPSSLIGTSRLNESRGKYADTAILELLRCMQASDSVEHGIVAHVAGGADMFVTSRSMTVGQQNIAATTRALAESNLTIASSHCGGNRARRLQFEIDTGDLQIEIVDRSAYAEIGPLPMPSETNR